MQLAAVLHEPKSHMAYAIDESTVHLRVRTANNALTAIHVIYGDKYAWDETRTEEKLVCRSSDEWHDHYEIKIQPPNKRLTYCFRLSDANEDVLFHENGFTKGSKENLDDCFHYPFLNQIDIIRPPEWVKDAIFYQIFPERFANGDDSLSLPIKNVWGEVEPQPDNFFGGDLQGVIDHLDHLETLGITAIYFTPVFKATTNHKYDTIDYMNVDPHFGDNALLKKLVDRCHERGIRVLLDAVFNHSGYYFPPFQDVLERQENSKYKDWFHLPQFPVTSDPQPNYRTFAFEPKMPKINTENPEVRAYFLEVARYWIEDIGVDGWRLDVANEVDHAFWREFRHVVKDVNPDAYILGEVWHESGPWLQGDQFDAVMNYPFTNAVLDYFCKQRIDRTTFQQRIERLLVTYPEQTTNAAFNLLDSHDTARLLTLCENDKEKMKQAVLFQFTFPGTPCVYYGDEVGLDGGHDPAAGKRMEWDEEKQDHDLFAFYKAMTGLRREHAALRDGSFQFIDTTDGVAYERRNEKETLIIHIGSTTEELTDYKTLHEGNGWTVRQK
ncbi:LOW QUALITY PROTEIN: neopullulanase [Geomicrobium sp. JCM 19037]|nr:LOW QUALITY PROTEIN: neopullulanase [Geomicrobium sp. JCM 19037]